MAEESSSGGELVGVSAAVVGSDHSAPESEAPAAVTLKIRSPSRQRAVVYIGVSEGSAAPVFSLRHEVFLDEGFTQSVCQLRSLPLPRGRYYVWVAITDTSGLDLTPWHPVTSFEVQGGELDESLPGVMRLSPVYVRATWDDG